MFTSLFLKMLNREAASARSKPEEVIESLQIREGQIIADIGSGGGFFTLALSQKTGKTGRVYAVDVKKKYLILSSAGLSGRDSITSSSRSRGKARWICR